MTLRFVATVDDAGGVTECVEILAKGPSLRRGQGLLAAEGLVEGLVGRVIELTRQRLDIRSKDLLARGAPTPVGFQYLATRRTDVGRQRPRAFGFAIPGLLLRFADVIVVGDVAVDGIEDGTVFGDPQQRPEGVGVHGVLAFHDGHEIVAKVVRVHRLVDASPFCNPSELCPCTGLAPRFVEFRAPVRRGPDEQRSVGVAPVGMVLVLPVADVLPRPQQGTLSTATSRPFQPTVFGFELVIEVEVSRVDVDILAPKRSEGGDTLARVDEEFEEGTVSRPVARIPEAVHLGLGEHVPLVVFGLRCGVVDVDIVGRDTEVVVAIERLCATLVAHEGDLRQSTVVVEPVDEGVELLGAAVEKRAPTLLTEAETLQVAVDRSDGECLLAPVGVEVLSSGDTRVECVGPFEEGVSRLGGDLAVVYEFFDLLSLVINLVAWRPGHARTGATHAEVKVFAVTTSLRIRSCQRCGDCKGESKGASPEVSGRFGFQENNSNGPQGVVA